MNNEVKTLSKRIAKNIKKLRKQNSYTQEYVADQLDLHVTTLQHYEGYQPFDIKISNLNKLAKFYNVTIDSLLK